DAVRVRLVGPLQAALLEGADHAGVGQRVGWEPAAVDGNRGIVPDVAGEAELTFGSVDPHLAEVRPLRTPDHLEHAYRPALEPQEDVRGGLDLLGVRGSCRIPRR